MPETVASADGTPLAVWKNGEGPPLVLIHGATADHSRWAPALPALEEHFTVYNFDRRGRGESGDAPDYALEREFEDVVAVVESAGTEVNLLGHSHGGVCALEAALLTDRIRKLVLYEPPMGFLATPREVVQELEALLQAGKRDELLVLFMREVAGLPPEQIEALRALPAWEARIAAADTIPREERVNREYAWDPDRFRGHHGADHVPPRWRQPRAVQPRRRGRGERAARLPAGRNARAAACRDRHRHRALRQRGGGFPRRCLSTTEVSIWRSGMVQ
jgi:pimeloyl-ACP methyl ester carboxylesterase